MTAALQSNMANSTPDLSGVEFATSADGLPVARIGDLVLAMVTSPSGIAFVASAGAIRRPLADLTRAEFIGHEGRSPMKRNSVRVSSRPLVTNAIWPI